MRQALLTCDRCGIQEAIPNGESAQGWRMIMNNVGTIDKDLCPACDVVIMGMFETPSVTVGLSRPPSSE